MRMMTRVAMRTKTMTSELSQGAPMDNMGAAVQGPAVVAGVIRSLSMYQNYSVSLHIVMFYLFSSYNG